MSPSENAPWYHQFFSLRWRLAVVYSALFGVFVVLLSILLYSTTSSLLLHSAQVAFPQRSQALRTVLIQEVCGATTPPSLNRFLQQNVPIDVDTMYLLDQQGTVIASSDGSWLQHPFPLLASSFFANAPDEVTQSFSNTTSNVTPSDGLLLSLHAPGECQAPQLLPHYLVLLTSYSSEQSTLRTILLMLYIISAFMIVLGALVIAFFTGVLFRPLTLVTRATKALAQGHLQQRVPQVKGHDEIADLAASFNQMAERIEQMFAAQQASEQRAQRFVSDASHELRTPITSLRGFTEVLLRGAKDDPTTSQHILSLMKNEAERMTELVSNLLTLARLDAGHLPTHTTLDLVDVAVECFQQAKKRAQQDCKLSLELETHERLLIQANGEQIKQLFLILLDNALKYGCTGEGKEILFLLNKQKDHAYVQIIDHGAGIAPDDLPRVFDRFYRGTNAYNAPNALVAGTGLGLSIALAIAHAYQGTLTVCSVPERETIFTVTFPCVG